MHTPLINGLTPTEYREFSQLKTKLFKGNMFVEFSTEETQTPEFKRYEELLQKKMNYLKSQTEGLNLENIT